jgi:hypothetical protein
MPPTSDRARRSAGGVSGLPAAAVLSFLKQTRAAVPWTERDLAKSLNITVSEARQALVVVQLEGYVAPAGETGKWRTTPQGELVSGSRPPRFTRESVYKALSELGERIRSTNDDPDATYQITEAVAFGDFLSDGPRFQSAEVGVRLVLRDRGPRDAESARDKAAELAFLRQLRGKSALLHLVLYEPWMSARSHRNLL